MPELSRFLGIVIAMFYRDHAPPHFHAYFGDFEVIVEIDSGRVTGRFPTRSLAAVQRWRLRNRGALLENWQRAQARMPLQGIDPLE